MQERFNANRQRVRIGCSELKKWLDVDTFVDCVLRRLIQNLKEFDYLWDELSANRQQTEWANAPRKNEELSSL